MGLLDDVKGLINQYAAGDTPAGDATAHFDQMAQSVDPSAVAQGIAAAFRSNDTPPFGQLVSNLFANGNADQKMAMINTLLSSISPDQRARLTSMIPGLANVASGAASPNSISPSAVQAVAEHVEQHDPGIVEKMSEFYAAHPTLVKTLGSVAVMIAMRKMAEHHR
ncbi:MAG TPA: hypothetical protein VL484_21190 [Vicinamibacterales bacterium]|jgi:hypothetical protein|nr:hypothetical protein [Vicinamibacterales bacterium]